MFVIDKALNPSVEQKVHDPFTLGSLIEWLRTKDPAEKYFYCLSDQCLWGQYTAAHGGIRNWREGRYEIGHHVLASDANALNGAPRFRFVAQNGRRSFGAALQRALSLQAGVK